MKLVTVHLPDLHIEQISELIREAVGKFLAKEKKELEQ